MSLMKPIQATPTLYGKDAERLIVQVSKKPSETAIRRNRMLSNVLRNIKKS